MNQKTQAKPIENTNSYQFCSNNILGNNLNGLKNFILFELSFPNINIFSFIGTQTFKDLCCHLENIIYIFMLPLNILLHCNLGCKFWQFYQSSCLGGYKHWALVVTSRIWTLRTISSRYDTDDSFQVVSRRSPCVFTASNKTEQ